jgi:ring-1,2-phenylacetyl-CoA epoxidase subunit PaaC
MTASITLKRTPNVQYLLRLADTCLIQSHRLSEWAGHAPVLEEDIALANMALDLLGQARALLTHVGRFEGQAFTEDQLAFLREERDYFNVTLVELPNGDHGGPSIPGDFAFTVLRNHALSTWLRLMWERLAAESSDAHVAAIAAKAVKEARYHEEHAADWVVRLGDGTDDSAQRMQRALARMSPYLAELFDSDAVDQAASNQGLGPAWGDLREPWLDAVHEAYAEANLSLPIVSQGRNDANAKRFVSTGKQGTHSEHMGFMLATMQHLQRSFPGGVW